MAESSEVLGMVSKKDKRRSGYVTPAATVSRNELLENDLFIEPFYDDWNDYRDGMRDCYRDFKLIKGSYQERDCYDEHENKRIRMNKKQRKLLRRREARKKNKYSNFSADSFK